MTATPDDRQGPAANAADRAAELRRQADLVERLPQLEDEAADALAAYREDTADRDLRETHRAAQQALHDARVALAGGHGVGAAVAGDVYPTPAHELPPGAPGSTEEG